MVRSCCITKVHGLKHGYWLCSAIFKTRVRHDEGINYAKINHKTIHLDGEQPRPKEGTMLEVDILEDWELKYA